MSLVDDQVAPLPQCFYIFASLRVHIARYLLGHLYHSLSQLVRQQFFNEDVAHVDAPPDGVKHFGQNDPARR